MQSSRRRIFSGIAIISAVQLGVELLFIKLSRYEFGTLSLGVIGLAMLGVALASPLTRLLGGIKTATDRSVLILPAVLFVSGCYYFQLEHQITDARSLYIRIIIAGLLGLVALALSSVPTYAEIVKSKGSVFAYYSASLIGATSGVVLAFICLYFFGDITTYVIQLYFCALAIWVFIQIPRTRLWGVLLSLALASGAGYVFVQLDQAAHPNSILTQTNAFSRIDVVHRGGSVYGFRTAGINGGTSTAQGEVALPPKNLINALSALPYHARPDEVLVLGSGAGKNVTQALHFGASRVVAVEINEMIPQAMSRLLRPVQNPYQDPRVELVVAEGREVAANLQHRGERYDMVYVPVATLFGSSGHALTQTYLMTTESISLYLNMLKPGGYVAIYFRSVIGDKLIGSVAAALGKRGIKEPEKHILAYTRGNKFVLLARVTSPIDEGLQRLLDQAPPGKKSVDIGNGISNSETLRFLSDDNPFLYNDRVLLSLSRQMFGYNVDFMEYIIVIICILLLAIAPLSLRNTDKAMRNCRFGSMSVFLFMGVAYALYQTGMIQRLTFLVGHPLVATSLVLPAMLAGTAAGAWWSKRIFQKSHAFRRAMVLLGLLLMVGFFAFTEPSFYILPNWPDWWRWVLAIGLSGLPSILMGTFFPVIFSRIEVQDQNGPFWAWLSNGLGGVLGAILGIYSAMMLGFSLTILLVLPLYIVVSVWDIFSRGAVKLSGSVNRVTALLAFLGLSSLVWLTTV